MVVRNRDKIRLEQRIGLLGDPNAFAWDDWNFVALVQISVDDNNFTGAELDRFGSL